MDPSTNVMDQKRMPGNFILEIADTGKVVTASLACFGLSRRVMDLVNKISLCATILTEVGGAVNKNEELFKDNFQQKFEKVILRCKKDNEIVLAALEKANSWVKSDVVEDTEDRPKKPWRKLLWALDMTEEEFEEFNDSLDVSYKHAIMTQLVVQLVIIQIQAQQRDLTPSEQGLLRRIKKNLGDLLEVLRESCVGSVMAFRLMEDAELVNVMQIKPMIDSFWQDSASTTTTSRTIRNPAEISVLDVTKNGESNVPPDSQAVLLTPPKEPDIFEIYRFAAYTPRKRTTFRLLGISLQKDYDQGVATSTMEKIPATQEEILLLLKKHELPNETVQKTVLESLMDLSPWESAHICTLMNAKIEPRTFSIHKWAFEKIIPVGFKKSANHFWSKKGKVSIGSFMVVMRGVRQVRPGPPFRPGPPPPPPGWPNPPQVIKMVSKTGRQASIKESATKKKSKPVVKVELSQKETETLVNDFLASFTTLYDNIPVAERGAALDNIVLTEDDDTDYDSDDSSTTSSLSLVDD